MSLISSYEIRTCTFTEEKTITETMIKDMLNVADWWSTLDVVCVLHIYIQIMQNVINFSFPLMRSQDQNIASISNEVIPQSVSD